jgi:hypothetical protein
VEDNTLQMLFEEAEESEVLAAGREASLMGSQLDSSETAALPGPEGK